MKFEKQLQPVALQYRHIIEGLAPTSPVSYALWAYLSNLSECERLAPTKEEIMQAFNLSSNEYNDHMGILEARNLIYMSQGRLTILTGDEFKG